MATGISETPKVVRLPNLLAEVEKGGIQIPRFQRLFVWDDDKRLSLLESIYRGYPIGSFMLWQSTQKMEIYRDLGPHPLHVDPHLKTFNYVMDGLQRLATLFDAFAAPVQEPSPSISIVADSVSEEDSVQEHLRPIYLDLRELKENPFKFLSARTECPNHWIRTSDLLNGDRFKRARRTLYDAKMEEEVSRAEAVRDIFGDYWVPVIYYVTDDLNKVTESFVRVNTQGQAMGEANIIYALLFAGWKLEEKLARVRDSLCNVGWQALTDDDLLTVIKVALRQDVYRTTPRALSDILKKESSPDGFFDTLAQHLTLACTLLNAMGICGPESLPYRAHLLGFYECVRQDWFDEPNVEPLQHWLWSTAYAEYFSGITSQNLRQHLDLLLGQVRFGARLPIPARVIPLQRFNYYSIRSKLLAHRMIEGLPERFQKDSRARLGNDGSQSIETLFPGIRASLPANRIVLPPRLIGELRAAMKQPIIPAAQKLLIECLGVQDAPQLLSAGRKDLLLASRQALLDQREADFVRSLGLEWSTADEIPF